MRILELIKQAPGYVAIFSRFGFVVTIRKSRYLVERFDPSSPGRPSIARLLKPVLEALFSNFNKLGQFPGFETLY